MRWLPKFWLLFGLGLLAQPFFVSAPHAVAAGAQTVPHTVPYIVKGIAVELPAGTPAQRREAAVDQATAVGLQTLLKRLTPPDQWGKHTWLISALNPGDVVANTHIVREETRGQRYLLTADITYQRAAIRHLLGQAGVPFSEVAPATILLIPVYEPAAGLHVLWEEHNPWRDVLKQSQYIDGLLTYTLPAGELADMQTLTPQMAVFGAQDALLALAAKYDTAGVLVLQARQTADAVHIRGDWYESQSGVSGKALQSPLVLTYERPAALSTVSSTVAGDQRRTPTLEMLLAQAATDVFRTMEQRWHAGGLVQADQRGDVFVRFAAADALQAHTFQATLRGLASVGGVVPVVLSQRECVFKIQHFGAVAALQTQLQQVGYALTPEGGYLRASPL